MTHGASTCSWTKAIIIRVHIYNFKSLEDFSFPSKEGTLAPLAVLVGLNGSGKSTVLQAFDFLGQLVGGNVAAWRDSRDWKPEELRTSLAVKGQKYSASDENMEPEFRHEEIPFKYEGSILSSLKLDQLHPALKSLKAGLEGLKSLDLLAPTSCAGSSSGIHSLMACRGGSRGSVVVMSKGAVAGGRV